MKTLIIMIIAGVVLSQPGISADTSSEDSAARDLAAAKSLAFGGVGVAGLMSEGERNLRAVLERPGASQQLQAALAHATPAGTLYILVGLRRCDRAAYQKVFDSLARSNDDVEIVRGCYQPPTDGQRRGGSAWLSAIFVSALWGIWHLPLLPTGGVAAFAAAIPVLIIVHTLTGVPLSFCWRASGTLVLPAAAHALIDSYRNCVQ